MGNSSSSQAPRETRRQQHHPPNRASAYPPAPVYQPGAQGPYQQPYGFYGSPPPGAPQYFQQAPAQYNHHHESNVAYSPYQVPVPKTQECQRTDTIRNQVNLKKPTLRLAATDTPGIYSITFKFDASAPCRITTFVAATEDARKACKISAAGVTAQPMYFSKGLEQTFPATDNPTYKQHCVDVRGSRLDELVHMASPPGPSGASPSTSAATALAAFPVIIRLEALTDDGRASQRTLECLEAGCELPEWVQAQTTYARIVQEHEGEVALRVIKQKIWYKGDSYELQEIYGMERGTRALGTPVVTEPVVGEQFEDVEGNECVICMCEPRDTAALPCRHMCMCHKCAGALKTQTNKCPICRNEIKKLLHIKINQQPAAVSDTSAAMASSSTAIAAPP